MQDILQQIANDGLQIGENWHIVQKGDNLWVQNFFNGRPSANVSNETEVTNNTIVSNETAGNQTFAAGGTFLSGSEEANQGGVSAAASSGMAVTSSDNNTVSGATGGNITVNTFNQTENGGGAETAFVPFSRYVFVSGQNVTL